MNWLADARDIVVALLLVDLNGFFVAADFALVKVRVSQLGVLGGSGSLAGHAARWLGKRLDASGPMCQLESGSGQESCRAIVLLLVAGGLAEAES